MSKTISTDSNDVRNALAKHSNRILYLVRFEGSGYNTVRAIDLKDAQKQAKAQFAKYGIVSVALPQPGEIEKLDAEWASRLA